MQFSDQRIKEIEEIVHQKYLKSFPEHMNRYTHILGVANMAKKLASIYGVDESRAYVCGLIHDYYKYESNEVLKQKLHSDEDCKECEKCTVLYHSFASSEALKDVFDIDDDEMKSAIKYHVFGHTNMTKLEEIVLISDYTEENRTYKDCIHCRNTLLNKGLNHAIYESTINTIKFLLCENKTPHPMQYEVLNEYERKLTMEKIKAVIKAIKKVNPTDITVYDLNHTNPFFDYVVVSSVASVRQANASINYIKEALIEAGFTVKSSEGEDTGWVLVDGCDILVHVFSEEERARVDIDALYLNAIKLDVEELSK